MTPEAQGQDGGENGDTDGDGSGDTGSDGDNGTNGDGGGGGGGSNGGGTGGDQNGGGGGDGNQNVPPKTTTSASNIITPYHAVLALSFLFSLILKI
ncbi:unnamed protein product [Rodentolepis nana]|uniref:Uncharacterized protein n=1 Tax=Rodentolepis nana TaxID=102285 RepID=A0A0R3TLS3_RODNA|nr:unnamed protein product [Rodentolepis nana]